MCLIHFNLQGHPNYKLIVAANRDEQYSRPTEKAHFWPDSPEILAGRDSLQHGTWLGVTKSGRFAALTNIRKYDLAMEEPAEKSRGAIVRGYLESTEGPVDFIESIRKEKEAYAGFNIILGDAEHLYHYNNVEDILAKVEPGTHSLSNATLNTPWPKVTNGKRMLDHYIHSTDKINPDQLFQILENKEEAEDSTLPETGIGIKLERKLSASFIRTPEYGTRSASVLLIDKDNQLVFKERTYQHGILEEEKEFNFSLPISI